jgi:hypothetical protein
MAANFTSSDIAVLKDQMLTVLKKLDSFDIKLDKQSQKIDNTHQTFLPRDEFNEWKKGQTYQKVLVALIVSIVVGVLEYGILRK